MAYWIQGLRTVQNMINYKSFMCDYRSDIEKLPRFEIKGEEQKDDTSSSAPCSYGSDAFVLEDSSVWILGKDTNKWKEV